MEEQSLRLLVNKATESFLVILWSTQTGEHRAEHGLDFYGLQMECLLRLEAQIMGRVENQEWYMYIGTV